MISVRDLHMHFPVMKGVLFQKEVARIRAVHLAGSQY